ncbi:hypothetical protein ACA910_018972 [Epithemia clementina (nom. ined.)]
MFTFLDPTFAAFCHLTDSYRLTTIYCSPVISVFNRCSVRLSSYLFSASIENGAWCRPHVRLKRDNCRQLGIYWLLFHWTLLLTFVNETVISGLSITLPPNPYLAPRLQQQWATDQRELFFRIHHFPPLGFDPRLHMSHQVAVSPIICFLIRHGSFQSASSRPLHPPGEGEILSEEPNVTMAADKVTPSFKDRLRRAYINGLDLCSLQNKLLEAATIDSAAFFWDPYFWHDCSHEIGFDHEPNEKIPIPARNLHQAGFGQAFNRLMDDCSRSNTDDSVRLEELGPDFSNLIRTHSETPTFNYNLGLMKFDPTMYVDTSVTPTTSSTSALQASSTDDNLSSTPAPEPLHIILDTGASHGLTMEPNDFIEIEYGNFGSMTTAADSDAFPIIATGIVGYNALSENGEFYRWTYPANLCRQAGVRLSSPQTNARYLNKDHRFETFQSNHVFASIEIDKHGNRLTVPVDHRTNLPIVKAIQLSPENKQPAGIAKRSVDCSCSINEWCRCSLQAKPLNAPPTIQSFNQLYNSHLLSERNKNLSGPQRQLLLDHQRLGHLGMRQLQRLYNPQEPELETDFANFEASTSSCGQPCLQPKFRTSSSCEPPLCEACMYGGNRRRPIQSKIKNDHPKRHHLTPNDLPNLSPGDLVSLDHYKSSVRGRLWTSKGKEQPHDRYVGGTIFFDHASKAIFVHHQVSLGSSDTVRSKSAFELQARLAGRIIQRYHTDNGTFTADAFEQSLRKDPTHHDPPQRHTLSGVGAHHQNGGAERAIQTVANMARCMLLHSHLR